MELSIVAFARYIIHKKGTYENMSLINRLIYEETLGEMRLGVILGALLQIFLYVQTFFDYRYYGDLLYCYRALYIALFALMVISMLVLMYVKRDIEGRVANLVWIAPLVSFFILSGAIVATCLDSMAGGFANPVVYMTVVLFIPVGVYMHPVSYIVLSIITDAAMITAYNTIRSVQTLPSAPTLGLVLYLIFKLVVGLMIFFMQFSFRDNNIRNENQKREISDLNNAQNRFFSSMSHEIRTPINSIIGFNEMILREKVSDEVAEDAANIRAASNMLLHLINDILDMSKISSGQMKLNPAAYRPGDMLSELVGMFWHRSREKGLEFHIEVAPDIPSELYGDEVRIKQVLINVLNNAIKYTKKGSVTLSIQCNGINDGKADIIYSVTDTGIGIKKENLPHLFTAFKRVDEDKNRYIEGTGLGLSIVKEITELMGGKVSVNSIYTQGSTFVIEIPQIVTDFSTIGNINLEEKHKANLSGRYKCTFEAPEAKVLAVDDNESNLLVVRKMLRDTKVMLDTAASGAEALELTLATSYDVIFMDHLMPDMDGIECLHKIRDQIGGISKSAKIVALTANAGSENRRLYSEEGFDGYLVKPVSSAELETELLRLLPRNLVNISSNDENILEESMSWLDSGTKKKSVVITTESVADIPRHLVEKYGIRLIPHKVETENGIFADGDEIDSDGLLDYMRDGHSVRTHAPSAKEHEDFFAVALSGAHNVIHLTISKGVAHSGYAEAVDGAAAFDNVTIVDTRHLSSGQGILTLEACIMASEGLPVAEIMDRTKKMRKYVRTSFIVDNLDYLARSGQIGKRIAAIGNAMMFHPVIVMKNSKMSVGRFYVGSRIRAWTKYINSTLSPISEIDKGNLFITYVGLGKKDLDVIMGLVEKRVHFDNVYCQKASPTIAVNSGPGTFGLLYKRKF